MNLHTEATDFNSIGDQDKRLRPIFEVPRSAPLEWGATEYPTVDQERIFNDYQRQERPEPIQSQTDQAVSANGHPSFTVF